MHFGGPVEHGRGFVLHSAEYSVAESSLSVSPDFAMTATVDILQDMARGEGPSRALLALGYAGWGPGQLEGEIQANGWLTAPADAESGLRRPGRREMGRCAALDLDRPAAALRRGRAGLSLRTRSAHSREGRSLR